MSKMIKILFILPTVLFLLAILFWVLISFTRSQFNELEIKE